MKKRILKYFSKFPGRAIKNNQLADELELVHDYEYEQMKSVLHDLITEGILQREGKRYMLKRTTFSNKLTGTLEINRSGFGFVIPQNKKIKGDIFIAERNLFTAFHGDVVEVQIFAKQKGKQKNIEGEVTGIVKRKWKEVAGVLHESSGNYFVVPDLQQIRRNIYVAKENLGQAKIGQKVVLHELVWDNPKLNPHGKVMDVVTGANVKMSELHTIAEEFSIPYIFPKSVSSEAEEFGEPVEGAAYPDRFDFRNHIVMTIDPDDAKDFDDALSLKELDNGNYEIGIHIADVSHYVQENSSLDKEALKRGNSTYLTMGVIPMLPENLSNSVCSLVPGKDRLTFSVVVELSRMGKIMNTNIGKSVIHSKRRFTYDEVQKIIEGSDGDYKAEILLLNKFASTFRQKRMSKGSIDFSSTEVKFILDENGTPVEIVLKASKESHKLVEEFMLLANKIVAEHIKKISGRGHKLPFVYRIHDRPDPEKLKDFVALAKGFGLRTPAAPELTPKMLNELIAQAKGRPEESLISEVGIRAMAKAEYSAQNIGHYGLGFSHYSHFTSPIRRYADLAAHRLLFKYINREKGKVSENALQTMCEHISATERASVEAERHSVKIKQIEFMKGKLGWEFTGIISGVTNYGMFIKLQESFAEGLLRIRDLDDDRYYYDEKKFALIGKIRKKQYRLGDKIQVKLVKIDPERMELDFIPVTE